MKAILTVTILSAASVLGLCSLVSAADTADPVGSWKCEYQIGDQQRTALAECLAHLARHIGFHADFPLDAFLRDSQLTAREISPSNLFGYWRLLRCVNEKPASALC